MEALGISALVFAVVATLFVVVLIGRRVYLASVERRRRELVEELKPLVLGIAEGEAAGEALGRADADVVAELVARFARRTRGGARARLGAYAEETGLVVREVRRLGARRAWVRARAAFVLGDLGSDAAVAPLLGALEDADRDVRTAAARSLGRLGAVEATVPLARSLAAGRVAWLVAGEALLAIGSAAMPALVAIIETSDPALRARVVELVGRLGDASDAGLLQHRLADESAAVRCEAARGLGRLGAGAAADALQQSLSDERAEVRAAAAEALGVIGDTSASTALLAQAQGDTFEPANAAAHALARLNRRLLFQAARRRDASPHVLEAADLAVL